MASEPDTVRTRGETPAVRPIQPEARRAGQAQTTEYHAEGKSPQQIRDDIDRTRAGMAETIDVIQERLDPQRLRAQAREAVRGATIGRAEHMAREVQHRAREAGFSLRDTVRNNPLPAAMVAVGLGWLAVQATMGGDGREVREIEAYPYRERDMMEGRTREMAGEARHRAEETMSRVQERAGETMGQAQERAGEIAGEVQHRAEEVTHEAQRQVQRARGRFETMMDENPLTMGVVALAVGAAIGMMLPSTRQEDRIMGEARDTIVHRAEEMAEETMGKVEEAAHEAERKVEETTHEAERRAQEEGQRQEDLMT